jgi:hypothetical protein
MMKLFTTSVAALGLAGFMLGGAVLPAAAAPGASITITTPGYYSGSNWHHRHHRHHRVKVRVCKNVWRHHHRVRVCRIEWRWH